MINFQFRMMLAPSFEKMLKIEQNKNFTILNKMVKLRVVKSIALTYLEKSD